MGADWVTLEHYIMTHACIKFLGVFCQGGVDTHITNSKKIFSALEIFSHGGGDRRGEGWGQGEGRTCSSLTVQ